MIATSEDPGKGELGSCYARLAAAIVEQAAKDANGYPDKRRYSNRAWQKEEVRRFFCDPDSLFTLCMPNTDGELMYNKIMQNYAKYGQWLPPEEARKAQYEGGITM